MKLDQSTTDFEIATKWGCSRRTARRWRQQGVDLFDDLAIMKHIVSNRSATSRMIAACKRNLKNLKKS